MAWWIAVGAGVSILGQHQQRRAQRNAERANAAYLEEQKRLSAAANRREADIFLSESERLIGTQTSMLGRAGIDFSGSALMALVSSQSAQVREHSAILTHGNAQARMTDLRARQARDMANFYGGFTLAATQTAGTLLNAYGSYKEAEARGIS